jgi:hypothetical protein
MAAPRNYGQQVAMNMGWSGAGQGEGGHIDWQANLSPEQRAEYNAAKSGGGVAPALAEPLNEWERAGLTRMNEGADTSGMESILAQFRNQGGDAVGRSSDYAATGASAITPEEVEASRNPYSQALKGQLSESAEKVRAQALVGQGERGGRSFGDTSTGVQMRGVNDSIIRGEGEIDYTTWRDAMADLQQGRGRNLQAAGVETGNAGAYGSNASNAFNMASDISGTGVANAQSSVGAGRYVRDFNQDINNQMLADIRARQGDELARLQNEQGLLDPYGSTSQSSQTGGDTNWMQQLGGAGQALSGAYNGGLPAGAIDLGNQMPWLS